MILAEKILKIEQVFDKLDQEISSFQSWSGLHCKFGCGKCCLKPDIEATILEFIPFAQYLYLNDTAFDWLDRLSKNESTICLIFNATQAGAGLCTEYKYRGLICRLFGFSARRNKYEKKEYVTCDVIKTEQPTEYANACNKVETEENPIPLMHNYYMKLHSIDMELTRDFYPINTAIKKAIETVLAYYAYRSN